jgi:hypothetical protein
MDYLGENSLKTLECMKKALSLKVHLLAANICPHKRKYADRRPVIQSPFAFQQRSKQEDERRRMKYSFVLFHRSCDTQQVQYFRRHEFQKFLILHFLCILLSNKNLLCLWT